MHEPIQVFSHIQAGAVHAAPSDRARQFRSPQGEYAAGRQTHHNEVSSPRGRSTEAPQVLPLSLPTRPAALGPRRRLISAVVERRLTSWLRRLLPAELDTPIVLSEWVAMDSRTVPHTVVVVVGHAPAQVLLVIEKASELIVEADVRRLLLSPGPPSRPRQ